MIVVAAFENLILYFVIYHHPDVDLYQLFLFVHALPYVVLFPVLLVVAVAIVVLGALFVVALVRFHHHFGIACNLRYIRFD